MQNSKLKIVGLVLGILALLVAASVVLASPGNKYGKAVTPPFPQPAEKDLQKIIFIRYAPGFQKDKPCDYNNVCGPDEKWQFCPDCTKPGGEEPTPTPTSEPTACYGFLSGSKPRWNWVEDYYTESGLKTTSVWATSVWDDATTGTIFGSWKSDYGDWGAYDDKNSVLYGNYPEAGVIAVTAIWFRGRNIYEYDIMLDEDYFPGGKEVDFDRETVMLHEFGHGAGLGDLYDVVCQEEVMYGYLGPGETRDTLGPGDTIGIQTLYGK